MVDHAEVASAPTHLTTTGEPKEARLSEVCESAPWTLKPALREEPVLRCLDFTVVQIDASDNGLGAVLSQMDDSGEEHQVVYMSKKLLGRQTKYPTIHKECLAPVSNLICTECCSRYKHTYLAHLAAHRVGQESEAAEFGGF